MGKVIVPEVPQWKNKNSEDNKANDDIVTLATSLYRILYRHNLNLTASLAAIRLVEKAALLDIKLRHSTRVMREASDQANVMVRSYEVKYKETT